VCTLADLRAGRDRTGVHQPEFHAQGSDKDSELILLLEFKNADATGQAVATVKQVLKGDCQDKQVTFDLLAMPEPMQALGKEIIGTIAAGDREALLFAGRFQAEGRAWRTAAIASPGCCITGFGGRL